MTSYQSKTTTTSNFDEKGWVSHINRTLTEELQEELDFNVIIFTVPKSLMACDPRSYVPQQVSVGPYHFLNPDVLEMEKYKIDAAKIFQKQIKSTLTFDNLVDQIKYLESKIRISYDKPVNLKRDTLALMLAIDSSFLLEFLKIYAVKEGKLREAAISSKMSHLVDLAGKKSSHNALLRDFLMLENQIPLFILKKMLQSQFMSPDDSDTMFLTMLMGLSKDVSPFKTSKKIISTTKSYRLDNFAHLLDYLFRAIVPELEGEHGEIIVGEEEQGEDCDVDEEKEITFENSSHVKEAFGKVVGILAKVNIFKKLTSSRSIKALMKVPLDLVAKIPVVDKLKEPIEKLFFSGEEKDEENPEDSDKAPLIEEITIPSVTELARAGIKFVPSHEGISSITFDPKTATLSLPVVCLDINSDVVLRNLVAYEACRAKGPLVLARNTEFMNGIVDTEEDATFLISKGIIVSQLKSQAEVASLWNGMDKSVRLTKVHFLDKVIDEVNKYYRQRWKVKAIKFARAYIFGSWKFLTFMATIMLLSMVALQAFCSVYTCSRWFADVVLENETAGKN